MSIVENETEGLYLAPFCLPPGRNSQHANVSNKVETVVGTGRGSLRFPDGQMSHVSRLVLTIILEALVCFASFAQ